MAEVAGKAGRIVRACTRPLPERMIRDFPRSAGASRHWGADRLLREGGKQRSRMLFLQQFRFRMSAVKIGLVRKILTDTLKYS
ncbi:MAG: hypothetical protein D3921_11760 [Candidatus Electrothrix sp. AW1]|nr:hypothetical protein [Candidatus Electrothrix sp. AX1]MCI5183168.1 hypothetical protein [Candidatus Electrothrix gigas]